MESKRGTILLTGFPGRRMETDNFQNPTGEIVKRMHNRRIGAYVIDGVIIDCELEERYAYIQDLFKVRRRVAALALGMSNIPYFKLESLARNIIDTTTNPGQIGGARRTIIAPGSSETVNNGFFNLLSLERTLRDADFDVRTSCGRYILRDLTAAYNSPMSGASSNTGAAG